MVKTGMMPSVRGNEKKVSKKQLAIEKKAKDIIAEEKRVREEKRAYWTNVNQEIQKVEAENVTWIEQLASDLTDYTLASWCLFGHEGSKCKFSSEDCTHYPGGCKWNKDGYKCMAYTRGECSMQHCPNQEKLLYKHSEYVYNCVNSDASISTKSSTHCFKFNEDEFANLTL